MADSISIGPPEAWAIRRKGTHEYLPARQGYGHSREKPTLYWERLPRLFPREINAGRALTAWLRGKWKKQYLPPNLEGEVEEIYYEPKKVESRRREDFEIVKFRLVEEEPD